MVSAALIVRPRSVFTALTAPGAPANPGPVKARGSRWLLLIKLVRRRRPWPSPKSLSVNDTAVLRSCGANEIDPHPVKDGARTLLWSYAVRRVVPDTSHASGVQEAQNGNVLTEALSGPRFGGGQCFAVLDRLPLFVNDADVSRCAGELAL
jgi:hypothetical protein